MHPSPLQPSVNVRNAFPDVRKQRNQHGRSKVFKDSLTLIGRWWRPSTRLSEGEMLGRRGIGYFVQKTAGIGGRRDIIPRPQYTGWRWCAGPAQGSTANVLSQLRKETGLSFAACKEALNRNSNNLQLARAWLQEQEYSMGLRKSEKLKDRVVREGLIGLVQTSPNVAALVEAC